MSHNNRTRHGHRLLNNQVVDVDKYSGKLHGMSYEEWKNAKTESQSITAGVQRAKEYKQAVI